MGISLREPMALSVCGDLFPALALSRLLLIPIGLVAGGSVRLSYHSTPWGVALGALPCIIYAIPCPTSREHLLLPSRLCQLRANVDHIDWLPRLNGPGDVKAKGQMLLFAMVWTKDFLARMLGMGESQLLFETLLLRI